MHDVRTIVSLSGRSRLEWFFLHYLKNDEKSRAYLVRIINNATQNALKRQGEVICMRFIFIPDLISIPLPILVSGQVLVSSTDRMFIDDIRFPNDSCIGEEAFCPFRIRTAEPSQSLHLPASPSPSLHNVSERLLQLNQHHSPSLSSRDGCVHGHRQEPFMSHITSNRSSPTAMPPHPYTRQEQQSSVVSRAQLNLHHLTSSS
jgi:hypothetical protein